MKSLHRNLIKVKFTITTTLVTDVSPLAPYIIIVTVT